MKKSNLLKYTPFLLVAIILVVIVSIYTFIQKDTKNSYDGKIQVATSFYPMYFFAHEIGGDKADITNITPVGAEPHDYEPTAQQIAKIQNSNMLIINGGVEPWADKLIDELQSKGIKIIKASEGLLTKELEENGEKIKDPHIWLNPILAKKEVNKILEGYKKVDSKNSQYYETNAQKLISKLDALNTDFENGLKVCKKKDIITSHEAFAYLAQEYNLNQVPIVGVSADEEPSSQKLADISDFVRKNNIKYIFFETLLSPAYSETIATETGAKTLVLNPLEGISNEESANGGNYFTVMQNNLSNLRTALECE